MDKFIDTYMFVMALAAMLKPEYSSVLILCSFFLYSVVKLVFLQEQPAEEQ